MTTFACQNGIESDNHESSEDFSKGGGVTLSKCGYSPDCHCHCCRLFASQKRGGESQALQDPPSYAPSNNLLEQLNQSREQE